MIEREDLREAFGNGMRRAENVASGVAGALLGPVVAIRGLTAVRQLNPFNNREVNGELLDSSANIATAKAEALYDLNDDLDGKEPDHAVFTYRSNKDGDLVVSLYELGDPVATGSSTTDVEGFGGPRNQTILERAQEHEAAAEYLSVQADEARDLDILPTTQIEFMAIGVGSVALAASALIAGARSRWA